jgi:hypothetical protein
MRLLLALLLLPAIGACTPPRPAANAHPPLMPDNPANGATPAAPPRSSATPAIAGLSPSAVAMSWMLGDWMCEVVSQGGGATQEAHVRGRLIVDTYMDVWLGAGFEPEALTAGVAKGDFYFTYDAGARAWTLVGFMSDGSHYTMSSPGELDGSMESRDVDAPGRDHARDAREPPRRRRLGYVALGVSAINARIRMNARTAPCTGARRSTYRR